MRLAGKLDNELHATAFRDFLYNRGIESDAEASEDGSWSIWVHDEDKVAEVGELLQRFRNNPDDPGLSSEVDQGAEKRRLHEKASSQSARFGGDSGLLRSYRVVDIGLVTAMLMAVSIVVTILLNTSYESSVIRMLAIYLPLVEAGQVWRLFTPIFMHFGILHILFNMLWLKDLGGMIESNKGSLFIGIFVALIAAVSNIAQYYVSGPGFGGMSGVVYAMLGYVWLQSRMNPWSGFVMHSFTMQMMLAWFVLGFTGVLGPIANATHAAGLVAGVVWGYLDARRRVA